MVSSILHLRFEWRNGMTSAHVRSDATYRKWSHLEKGVLYAEPVVDVLDGNGRADAGESRK